MTKHSVLLPFTPSRPEHSLPFAAFVQHRDPHRLWQGQSFSIEPHQTFAYIAAAGFRIPVGTGVALMPLQNPLQAALQARSLAAVTGQPVTAGFGPSGTVTQAAVLGRPYEHPLTAAREYLTIVRGLLAAEHVDLDGSYFTMHASLPPVPGLSVELGLGVLRPRMAELAGELADVAVTWLTPPHYLAEQILPALRLGADAAGRTPPRVVAIVPVALGGADRDPVELFLGSAGAHVQAPHYRDMLRRAGILVDPSDPHQSAHALMEGSAYSYGDPPELLKLLDAYRAVGVDEIVVNMTGTCQRYGARAVLDDLIILFDEIERSQQGQA